MGLFKTYLEFEHAYLELGGRPFLSDFSLQVGEGERWVIFGPYGCGKSLIARTALGLIPLDAGRLHVLDQDVSRLHHEAMLRLRRQIGFVPRDNQLISNLNVRENLALPLHHLTGMNQHLVDERVDQVVRFLGLRPYEAQRTVKLPPMVQKRVAIGQAIGRLPDIVIVDGLRARMDPIMRGYVNRLLYQRFPRWWKELRQLPGDAPGPIMLELCTNLQGVLECVDLAGMLCNGKFVFQGPREDLERSESPFVRQFLSGSPDGPINYQGD